MIWRFAQHSCAERSFSSLALFSQANRPGFVEDSREENRNGYKL